MISKIEILKDEPASYNWRAEKINPIWEYEWEKRSVVEIRPPEEPVEENPVDFEEELKLNNYVLIPMYRHMYELNTTEEDDIDFYSYRIYKNGNYVIGLIKNLDEYPDYHYAISNFSTRERAVADRLKLIYNLTDEEIAQIPNIFQWSNWELVNTVDKVPVHYSMTLESPEWDKNNGWHYEHNPNSMNDTEYRVAYTHWGGYLDDAINYPNTPYSNATYYPELLYITDFQIIKRLLRIWLDDEWELNPNNIRTSKRYWYGVNTYGEAHYYNKYYRVCKFPCYIKKKWNSYTNNNGVINDSNIKYDIPELIKTTNGISVIFNDQLWQSPLEKGYIEKGEPYWRWYGDPINQCDTYLFYNLDYYSGDEPSPEPSPEPEPEITYEKGYLIEKLYSQNKNDYPEDAMDENHQYWYTLTSQKIISYTFTKQYQTITNVNKDAFPQKGTKYYNGNYYWFTYTGVNREVLTTFESNVLLDNIDYVQSTGNNHLFTIGNVAGASIQFDVWKPLKDVLPYAGMDCRYYQKREKKDEYILEGIFNIQEVNENGLNKTTVIAYDNAKKLNMDARVLIEKLYYPTSLYQMFIIMCSYCNIPYDLEIYFPHMNEIIWNEIQFENENEEISCRDVLEWIAQIAGGIFVVDYDGKIIFRDLQTPLKINGSYESTNYSLNISKIPILKPSKVVYGSQSIVSKKENPFDSINVIDLTKNPIIAVWNDEIRTTILQDILNSVGKIPDIYPMECHIGDDKAIRQCGDYWVIETNGEVYLSIITEKRINSSGIVLKCNGDIVPYLTDYELSSDEIDEVVETYKDTFFRFYYNQVVLKDVSNYNLITLDRSGYIDENNLILDISNIQFVDGSSTVTKSYFIDFSSCINELLIKDGINVKLGNGIYVSFIDNILYIQDTRYWRKAITETKFYYKVNESSVLHPWNHNNNSTTYIDETTYYLNIMSCYTSDLGVNDTKQFMYIIAMLMKAHNSNYINAVKLGDYYRQSQWRFNFGDGQNVVISTRNKFPSIFFINGIRLIYNDANNSITFQIIAGVKETDTEHVGEYITVSFVETEYYYLNNTGSVIAHRNSYDRLKLVNAVGDPVSRLYNGEYAYVFLKENDALVISYNQGFYNNIGIRITSCGNDVQFYAEKSSESNSISIDLFTEIDRSRETIKPSYYQGNIVNTLYKVWNNGDGVYVTGKNNRYYNTVCPLIETSKHLIIEYIDENNESYFYVPDGFNDINGRLHSAEFDSFQIDENTSAHTFYINDNKLKLQVAFVNHEDVDIYSTDKKKFEILVDNNKYDIRAINYSKYSNVSNTNSNGYEYYDLYIVGHDVQKHYISGGTREQATRLMLMTHRDYWNHLTEYPKQGYWVVKNLFSNGEDIRLAYLATWDYIQIRPIDKEGSL